jgi:hypothetical protein
VQIDDAVHLFDIASDQVTKAIDFDVRNANRLLLKVESGPDGDAKADVNWVDAWLVK